MHLVRCLAGHSYLPTVFIGHKTNEILPCIQQVDSCFIPACGNIPSKVEIVIVGKRLLLITNRKVKCRDDNCSTLTTYTGQLFSFCAWYQKDFFGLKNPSIILRGWQIKLLRPIWRINFHLISGRRSGNMTKTNFV